jgi:hypothetical protein
MTLVVMRNPLVSQEGDIGLAHHHHTQIIQAMIDMYFDVGFIHRVLLWMEVVPDLFDAM